MPWMAPLSQVQTATLRVRPQDGSASQVNLELAVACKSVDQATQVARQMSQMAETLRAAGLPNVTGGQFSPHGIDVAGAWTLDRTFLEKLVGGPVASPPAL